MNENLNTDRCIVTLADSNYYPGLETLYWSIQESFSTPLICYDIGLTAEQKELIKLNKPLLTILPLPDTLNVNLIIESFQNASPLSKPGKRVWPLWLCPFLIAACPYKKVFWMDCDLIILRNLQNLFEMLDSGPVFTPENLAPDRTPNKPELYKLLPIERSFDPNLPRINAGVSGWDLVRDKPILDAYKYPILQACHDQAVREAISWHDQGALIWAIQHTGLEHRVLENWSYNLCVKHTSLLNTSLIWNKNILSEIRRQVDDANIIHWNGHAAPWVAK